MPVHMHIRSQDFSPCAGSFRGDRRAKGRSNTLTPIHAPKIFYQPVSALAGADCGLRCHQPGRSAAERDMHAYVRVGVLLTAHVTASQRLPHTVTSVIATCSGCLPSSAQAVLTLWVGKL